MCDVVCGGRLLASTGTLTSPGWPSHYPPNKDCTWTIEAPLHQQIELSIDEISMERQHACELDYVEFRNGGTETAPLIGRWCDGAIPKTIRSFTNKLHIRFASDSSISDAGFKMQWIHTMTGKCCRQNHTHTALNNLTIMLYRLRRTDDRHPRGCNNESKLSGTVH